MPAGKSAFWRPCPLDGTSIPSRFPPWASPALRRRMWPWRRPPGTKIKLLGRALRLEDGKVVADAAPHLLDEDHQLAGVEDVFNGIAVCGDAIGDVMFYGRGAGKLPTASAVSADIIDAVKHKTRRQMMDWAPGGPDVMGDFEALPMAWYLRTDEREMRIGAALGDATLISQRRCARRGGGSDGPHAPA